jgi:hypothetical protein
MNVICPCCEHESDYIKWYNLSNDSHLICPICKNVIQYNEVENQLPKN